MWDQKTQHGEERDLCYRVKKEKHKQILNKPKPTNTNTKPTPISKTQITRSNSVRGDFWGMHKIDLKRLDILGFVTVW